MWIYDYLTPSNMIIALAVIAAVIWFLATASVQLYWTAAVCLSVIVAALGLGPWWTKYPIGCLFTIWLAASWRIIPPNAVALRQWFGRLEEVVLDSGLAFVPFSFGLVTLRMVPKDVLNLQYFMDPTKPGWCLSGDMIGVRSLDGQKLNVEVELIGGFPYDEPGHLKMLIEANVPLDQAGLKTWLRGVFASDLLYIFGQKTYDQVMGGLANDDLNREINIRLRDQNGVLYKRGFFGEDPVDNDPGTGEIYLKVTNVHLPEKLGKRLLRTATAKLEAKIAPSIAERDGILVGGKVRAIVAGQYGMKPEDITATNRGEFEKDFMFAQRQTTYDRSQEVTFSNDHDTVEVNVHSAGKPMNGSGMAEVIAAIGAGSSIAAAARGGRRGSDRRRRKDSSNNPTDKKKRGGQKDNPADDDLLPPDES